MENSRFYDKTNKNVISSMKDVTETIPVLEFIRLKSKMFSYIKEDD